MTQGWDLVTGYGQSGLNDQLNDQSGGKRKARNRRRAGTKDGKEVDSRLTGLSGARIDEVWLVRTTRCLERLESMT